MTLIRIRIHQKHKLQGKIVRQGSKLPKPITYGGMGNLNAFGNPKNQGDATERILPKIENVKSRSDYMKRISNTIEITLAIKYRHRIR